MYAYNIAVLYFSKGIFRLYSSKRREYMEWEGGAEV